MTYQELDLQLKALSEKLKQNIVAIKDLGDGSIHAIPDNQIIRISSHDMEIAVKQFKLKYGL